MHTTRFPRWRRVTAQGLIYLLILMSSWSIAPPGAFAATPRSMPPLVTSAPRLAAALSAAPLVQAPPPPVTFFGPKRYTRTSGPPNQFSDTVTKSAWLTGPFTLRIVNGEANGDNRITSAEVKWNGVTIAGPSDFNQNVGLIERVVTMPAATAALSVKLQSGPGRYLTINVVGTSGDTQAVDLVVVTPQDQSVTPDTTPDLQVTYADIAVPGGTASGVDEASFKLFLDGTDRTSWVSVGSASATGVVPNGFALALGGHMVRAEIRDLAGNLAVKESNFTVGATVPQPTITSPTNGSAVRGPAVSVTGTFPGGGAGLTVSCDAGTINAVGTISGNTFSCILPLPDGAHTIQAALVASTTAQATTQVQVVVDSVAPTLTVTAPANGAYVQGATVTVAGTVADALPVAVMVNGVAASVSGGQFSLAAAIPASGSTASYVVTAIDAVGNSSAPQTVTVNVLRSPLTVAITSPAAGAVLASTSVTVQGTTSNELPVQVQVNGVPATVTNGQFTAQITLAEGARTITAVATDAAGRTATADRAVTIDTSEPGITITSPTAGVVTNAAQVHVAGTVADSTAVSVTVNGVNAPITNGQFAVDLPTGADGTLVISVVATDAAGHAVTRTVSLVVDRTAPTLQITAPAAGSTLTTLPVVVQGTASDATALQVTVDGVAATLTSGTWQASFATLAEGSHTFIVVATDGAGNTTQRSVAVTIERAAPTPTIASPGSNATVRGPGVTVSGTFADAGPGVTAACDAGAVHADGVVNGTSLSCQLTLSDGPQTIVVTLRKSAGNEATAQVQVTVDGSAPVLSVSSPLDGSWTAASSVTVAGTVADGLTTTVTVNGTPAPVSNGAFSLSVPVGTAATLPLQIVVEDEVGNRTEQTVTVYVARTPLTVSIAQPAAGAVLQGPMVEVRGTTSTELHVDVDVNGEPATMNGGQFTALIPLLEGARTIHVVARDAAGRTAEADRAVIIDTIAPAITVTAPTAGFVTNAATVHVAGMVTDVSAVVLKANGVEVPVVNGAFAVDVPIAAEGQSTIALAATDAAANTSTKDVVVVVDRTAPTLEIAAPTAGALVTGLPIIVQGVAMDATALQVTVDGTAAPLTDGAWQAAFASLTDGPHTFTVIATDAGGNATTRTVAVTLDTAPPVLTILSPLDGSLTRDGLVDVSGTVEDVSPVTVSIGGRSVTTSSGTFTISGVALAEGDNTITVVATDGAGRSSQAARVVTQDGTPPTIQVSSPERITRQLPGQALAAVTDANGVAQVVLRFGAGDPVVLAASPFVLPLAVPTGATVGQTVVVTVTATDRAGNVATANRGIRVGADGAIVGQVLSDRTGLPIEGATVTMGSVMRPTDAQGRYTLPTSASSVVLTATQAGMTSVTRGVSVAADTGTVPVDARLTPLAAPTTIGSAGGTVTAAVANGPNYSVEVPAGAVGGDMGVVLTPLSPQGLPDLLPLGWSPLAAVDLRGAGPIQGALALTITLPTAVAQAFSATPALAPATLVEYRPLVQSWVVVARDLLPDSQGRVLVTLPRPGPFALVTADIQEPALVTPAVDDPLTGVPAVLLPFTAISRGEVAPAVLPPTGGTAEGRLLVEAPLALPSGTLVQAEIGETFTLPSGRVASEELRRADVVLYRAPAVTIATTGTPPPAPTQTPIAATFPIVASRTFNPADFVEGRVHLDILAGREGIRGTTGGRDTVTSTDGDARLIVPGGALVDDTAVRVTVSALSSFLPAHAALTPLAEVVVDLSGQILAADAELSFGGSTAAAGGTAGAGTFVIARVERLDGLPFLTPVALAELVGGRLVPQATPELAGLRQGGRYVVYHVNGALGRLSGVTRAGGLPVSAVVSTDTLPFAARSGADGRYALLALAGPLTATARVPSTALQTQGSATIVAGDVATLDLTLAAQVTTAVVAPADGARAVPRHTQFAVTTSAPLTPASVASAAIALTRVEASGPGTPVSVRVVLAGSGRTLSIVPTTPLDADRSYRLAVAGLVDTYGAVVAVAPVTIQTVAETAPTYSPESLTASFPDAQGRVTLSAPAGSFPSGTQFLVINASSGEVLSFSGLNDGSVSARVGATINDRLVLTITDPDGRVTTVTKSQFVDLATGQTAIGPGGGVVTGAGGVELRIPEGALPRGATFKIAAVPEAAFPVKPALLDTHFGGGVRLESADQPKFAKEVDIAFPLPQAAIDATAAAGRPITDAVFLVLRRVQDSGGRMMYETLDYANVEGEGTAARVVTASDPFKGVRDFLNTVAGGVAASSPESYVIMVWAFDQLLPGRTKNGVITGVVQYLDPATLTTRFAQEELRVTAVDSSGNPLGDGNGEVFALTQVNGRFTLIDPHFTAGPVQVQTMIGSVPYRSTVFTVPRDPVPIIPGVLELFTTQRFKEVGHANITIPPPLPPDPVPAITLRVFRTSNNRREDIQGLTAAETSLTFGVTLSEGDAFERGVELSLNSEAVAIAEDRAQPETLGDPRVMQAVSSSPFTPVHPGTYTLLATLANPAGPALTQTLTFRVIANGGNVDTDPAAAPAVLDARVTPARGATDVSVAVAPQVAFSEPVRNVPGHVRLLDETGAAVSMRLSGVGIDSQGAPIVIADLTSAAATVTAVTLVPLRPLAFGKRYRLVADDAIVDLDSPDPKPLANFEAEFKTFAAASVGTSEATYSAAGQVAIDGVVYVLETTYGGGVGGAQRGQIRTYAPVDPKVLTEVPPAQAIEVAPRDIAGDGNRLVVTTMPRTQFMLDGIISGPGTLLVYDIAGATPILTGVAALSDSIEDGVPSRVAVKEDIAYVSTWRKGLQVVDLGKTASAFAKAEDWRRFEEWFSPGKGENFQALAGTIPVPGPTGLSVPLADLEVFDLALAGAVERVILATGRATELEPGAPNDAALVVASPRQMGVAWRGPLADGNGKIDRGSAIAVAHIADLDLAVVGGYGTTSSGEAGARGVLAVVDLRPLGQSPITAPEVLSWMSVDHEIGDVLIVDDVAVVSTTVNGGTGTLFSLADPRHPQQVGRLENLGVRLSASGGVLFSSNRTLLLERTAGPGVRSALLGEGTSITRQDPMPIMVSSANEVVTDVTLGYRLTPADPSIDKATVAIRVAGGSTFKELPGDLANGAGEVVWKKPEPLRGDIVDPNLTYVAEARVVRNGQPVRAYPRRLRLERTPLAITSYDRAFRIQFAIPEAAEARDYAVQVFLAAPGSAFGPNPTYTIDGTRIRSTPVSEDGWCPEAVPSSETSESWLVCRIDEMVRVPGTTSDVRRQAFELATVFAGYPKVRVVIRRTSEGVDLVSKEGVVTRDSDWAEVVAAAERRLAAAAGIPVDVNAPLPPVVFEAARALGHVPALAYRVLAPSIWLREKFSEVPWKFLEGFAAGYWSAYDGDVETLRHPIVAAQKAYADAKKFFTWLKAQPSGPVQAFALALRGYNYLTSDGRPGIVFDPVAFANTYAYASGYLVGMALEQLASGLAVSAVTLGAGAIATKAVGAIVGIRWVVVTGERTAKLLRALSQFVQELAVVEAGEERLRKAWEIVKGAGDAAIGLVDKYPQPRAVLRESAELLKSGRADAAELIRKSWHYLGAIDRLSDEAAKTFFAFMKQEVLAAQWMEALTGPTSQLLRNARRAIAGALEAFTPDFRGIVRGPELAFAAATADAGGDAGTVGRMTEKFSTDEFSEAAGNLTPPQIREQPETAASQAIVSRNGKIGKAIANIDGTAARDKLLRVPGLGLSAEEVDRVLDVLGALRLPEAKRAVSGILQLQDYDASYLSKLVELFREADGSRSPVVNGLRDPEHLLALVGRFMDGDALIPRMGMLGSNRTLENLALRQNAKGEIGHLLVAAELEPSSGSVYQFGNRTDAPGRDQDLLFDFGRDHPRAGTRQHVEVKNVNQTDIPNWLDEMRKDVIRHSASNYETLHWRIINVLPDKLEVGRTRLREAFEKLFADPDVIAAIEAQTLLPVASAKQAFVSKYESIVRVTGLAE